MAEEGLRLRGAAGKGEGGGGGGAGRADVDVHSELGKGPASLQECLSLKRILQKCKKTFPVPSIDCKSFSLSGKGRP